jgi:hypothetical protein
MEGGADQYIHYVLFIFGTAIFITQDLTRRLAVAQASGACDTSHLEQKMPKNYNDGHCFSWQQLR